MPINVPNPYSVDVAISPSGGRAIGLQAAPETRYSKTRMAEDLKQHGLKFMQKLEEWQGQIDVTRSKDLINQLEESRIDLRTNPETGYQKLEGENALERPSGKSLQEEVTESFRTTFDRIRAKASTQRQRKILDDYYQAASQRLGQDVGAWVVKQQDVYDKAVEDRTLQTAVRKAMSDDPDEQRDGEFVIRDMLARKSKREGVPQDSARYLGPIHLKRLTSMVDADDIDGATNYLELHRDEMTAEQSLKVQNCIDRAKTDRRVESVASQIVAESGGSRAGALRAVAGVDSDIRADVRKQVDRFLIDKERIENEEKNERADTAWRMILSGEKVPPSLMQDIFDTDVSEYKAIQTYLTKESEGGVKTNDMNVWKSLMTMIEENPERFQNENLDRYSAYLTQGTINGLKRRQAELGKTGREDFIKAAKQRGRLEGYTKSQDQAQIEYAATEMWDQMVTASGGVPPVAEQDRKIDTLFMGSESGIFGKSKWPAFKAAAENRDKSITDLTSVEWEPGEIADVDLGEAMRDFDASINPPKVFNPVQKKIATAIYTSQTLPKDVEEKARKECERILARRKAEGLSPQSAKVTNRAILKMAVAMHFKRN